MFRSINSNITGHENWHKQTKYDVHKAKYNMDIKTRRTNVWIGKNSTQHEQSSYTMLSLKRVGMCLTKISDKLY